MMYIYIYIYIYIIEDIKTSSGFFRIAQAFALLHVVRRQGGNLRRQKIFDDALRVVMRKLGLFQKIRKKF